jgi:hypothetical protein
MSCIVCASFNSIGSHSAILHDIAVTITIIILIITHTDRRDQLVLRIISHQWVPNRERDAATPDRHTASRLDFSPEAIRCVVRHAEDRRLRAVSLVVFVRESPSSFIGFFVVFVVIE